VNPEDIFIRCDVCGEYRAVTECELSDKCKFTICLSFDCRSNHSMRSHHHPRLDPENMDFYVFPNDDV